MRRTGICLGIALCAPLLRGAEITARDGLAVLRAGTMERAIRYDAAGVRTTSLRVGGREMLAGPAREFSVVFTREQSGRRPVGLRPEEAGERIFFTTSRAVWRAEGFDPARYDDTRPTAPKWVDPRPFQAGALAGSAAAPEAAVTRPAPGVTRLSIRIRLEEPAGVAAELHYEVYDGHAAIRKWAVVRNGGPHWLKLDRMVVEDLHLAALTAKPLAAAMFGVQPSVVAFEGPGARYGVIAASEIPSALRWISGESAMGYTPALFEWVLGPGEEFTSEPVFYYGYAGAVRETVSSVSLPLDRTVEGPYMEFLKEHVGIAAERAPMHGPQWMTWAYFADRIDDPLVRRLAELAARAGFTEMLLDDGWQKGRLGTDVDQAKFPDFGATADFIRRQGLQLGLWVSCFRDADSRDARDMPEARVLPMVSRSPTLPGVAMSFASPWRDYFVKDLVETARRFGATYLKQDFTNIMYGDLAEGHESRTRKESLLRGLRGLLAAEAGLRRSAPEIVNEVTHEIYWGTPGVPADLAALKHAARFHIPPNVCAGADVNREFPGRTPTAAEHAAVLRGGCWLARQRFYSHRGLPLYPLEFYGAATTSFQGSLTPDVQDRQVASWLMGMPVCFSGDLRTLSDANLAHYRRRLVEVRRLESAYGIYRHFQFSGVPEPTDVDWHWWGKLNREGYGAVVVLRGAGGAPRRAVNIPWVLPERSYRVAGLFSGKSYGVVSGKALRETGLPVALAPNGQELLELAPAAAAYAAPASARGTGTSSVLPARAVGPSGTEK